MDESSYYEDTNPLVAIETTIRYDIAALELDIDNIQSIELKAFAQGLLQQKRLDLLELYMKFGQAGAEQE